MIEAKDLRIGNWIFYKKQYATVDGFYSGVMGIRNVLLIIGNTLVERECEDEDTNPIPLTPEILEKYGFEWENEKHSHMHLSIDSDFLIGFYFKDGAINQLQFSDSGIDFFGTDLVPKYVHQLQNLYYALTNSELTITR